MAVGAVDNTLDIAFFSARSSELEGGQVDIAGPGVDFSAAEVAAQLDTTVASVNSALQRARNSLDQRVPEESQQATLRALGAEGRRELVDAFVAAWERADVPAILGMLVEDARLTMPPLSAWFHGLDDLGLFMTERMFQTPWRLVPCGRAGSWRSPATRGIPTAPASGSVRCRCSRCVAGGSSR